MFLTYIVNWPLQGTDISAASRISFVSRLIFRAGRVSNRGFRARSHGWRAAACFLALIVFGVAAIGQASAGTAARGTPALHSQNQTAAAWRLAQSNPGELVRRASQNELASSGAGNQLFRFRLRKVDRKSDTTKEIVNTRDGGVARLIAIDGHPLPPDAERKEIARLRELEADPDKQRHRRESEAKDAKRVEKFTRLLPQAFLYSFAGQAQTPEGTMIRLKFVPNPKFSPPDLGSRVMTGIRGEVWIDPADVRIVHILGKFFRQVDFGWGIVGVLYPGGIMRLDQSKTPACGWQLSRLSFHLIGMELIFKSIVISVDERAGDYQPVPKDWTYRDAIQWLLQLPS
jgi:hypothetical protein